MSKLFEISLKHSKITIFLYFIFSIISFICTLKFLEINTSTESLINENLEFKINHNNLKKEFPILNNNILIRVVGKNTDYVNEISSKILKELRNRKEITFAYSPTLDTSLTQNFFNLLNQIQKDEFINELYTYQPFLSEINNNPKLEGFNNLLELTLKNEDEYETNLKKFDKILSKFSNSLENKTIVNWTEILQTSSEIECFLIIGVSDSYLKKNSFDEFYSFLKSFQTLYEDRVKIDFTGGLMIDHEEVSSVAHNAIFAGFLSIILVGFVLWLAFRNLKIILSLIISILSGLLITMGLSTFLVGTLNLISVAFAVLFIGLSVDFGIQICSRIIENKNFYNLEKIIKNNVLSIFNTLFIAAIPSMIGFLSFMTTDYTGLSELGIISFIGLVIGLSTNIILLPSLLKEFSIKKRNVKKDQVINAKYFIFITYVIKNKTYIFFLLFLIVSFTLLSAKKIAFDSDALNLKDQKLGSVILAKELIENNPTSDYVISTLIHKDDESSFIKLDELRKSENIKSFFSYNDIVKNYQSDDLDYLKFLLSSSNSKFYSNISEFDRLKRYLNMISSLDIDKSSMIAKKLLNQIDVYSINDKNSYLVMQDLFFNDFGVLIKKIQSFGDIEEKNVESLPEYYKKRYFSDSSFYRVEIFPSTDVSKKENLKNFVKDVEIYFPLATGMPMVQYYAGEIVIHSFIKAFTISIVFLLIFIFVIFKRLVFVVFCLCSLLIATIMTLFLMILFDIDFNFANMIALPLLYSLGISYPIYFLRRFLELRKLESVISSNTPKAILFSGVTTILSFSTLAISQHNGTSSMGIMLFISLSMTLLASIVLLPIMIKIYSSQLN